MKNLTFIKKKKKLVKKGFKNDCSHIIFFRKTNTHFYATLYDNIHKRILYSVSSLQKDFKVALNNSDKIKLLSNLFLKKFSEHIVTKCFFDRQVYRYHGHVKNFVECLRNSGVKV